MINLDFLEYNLEYAQAVADMWNDSEESWGGFYNEMYDNYNIDKIELMENISPSNLLSSAKACDNSMKEYAKNYKKIDMDVKLYKSLDEFEKGYLD